MNTLNNELCQRFNPLNDYLFFRVMGEKGDEVQLLGFLNAVLDRSGKELIKSLEILENKSFPRKIRDGKSCVLDVLAVLCDGTRVNIEVQLGNEYNMDRRSLFYWSKVYSESLEEGQNYRDLPNVIAVNIVDFNFPSGRNLHTCFHLREDTDPSLVLSAALEIHCINMVQWRKLEGKDILTNPLHRWLAWFDEGSPPEMLEEVVKMDGAIAEAYKKLEEAMQDQDAYRAYWAERKFRHDMVSQLEGAHDEGFSQGLEQGAEKSKIEIVRKMKAAGRPLAEISEFTGLLPAAIENLDGQNK